MSVVLQKNFPGKKASKLILGRFQIMEAWLKEGEWYVWDHVNDDNVRDKKGEITYFDSYSSAEKFINATPKKSKK
jgi:hypothetical protein